MEARSWIAICKEGRIDGIGQLWGACVFLFFLGVGGGDTGCCCGGMLPLCL